MNNQGDIKSAEIMLAEYRKTHAPALREQLTKMHLYIASIIAKRFSKRGVEYDDLFQVASLALLKAIERFDVDKGAKFVTFATPTMVGEVKNYFRDKSRMIQLPRRATSLNRRLCDMRVTLEQALMRAPTALELASALDVPLDTVLETLEMRGAMSVASLEATSGDSDESPLMTYLGEEDAGFSDFERRDQVQRALSTLEENERRVVRERFFDGRSQREIAERMDVSQMTISRIERKALSKIKAYMELS